MKIMCKRLIRFKPDSTVRWREQQQLFLIMHINLKNISLDFAIVHDLFSKYSNKIWSVIGMQHGHFLGKTISTHLTIGPTMDLCELCCMIFKSNRHYYWAREKKPIFFVLNLENDFQFRWWWDDDEFQVKCQIKMVFEIWQFFEMTYVLNVSHFVMFVHEKKIHHISKWAECQRMGGEKRCVLCVHETNMQFIKKIRWNSSSASNLIIWIIHDFWMRFKFQR